MKIRFVCPQISADQQVFKETVDQTADQTADQLASSWLQLPSLLPRTIFVFVPHKRNLKMFVFLLDKMSRIRLVGHIPILECFLSHL